MKPPVKKSPKKLLKETDDLLAQFPSLEETFGPEAVAGLKQVLQQQRIVIVDQIGRRK